MAQAFSVIQRERRERDVCVRERRIKGAYSDVHGFRIALAFDRIAFGGSIVGRGVLNKFARSVT
jgi:hypothetical protein